MRGHRVRVARALSSLSRILPNLRHLSPPLSLRYAPRHPPLDALEADHGANHGAGGAHGGAGRGSRDSAQPSGEVEQAFDIDGAQITLALARV